jgi:molybdenum cofactor synthesis domain-containing protein
VIPLEEARRRVLAACAPLRPRAVPLGQALGCVTSVDLRAEEPVPPFANTAVDGFAVRSGDLADLPTTLAVIGTIAAGAPPEPAIGPGQTVRILTGAPMPPGADAVVMVEDTDAWDGRSGREAVGRTDATTVTVRSRVQPGGNVREAGSDVFVGQEVFGAGTALGPGHLGVLASIGVRKVPVFPRARVGVLSTGDELVDGPGPLAPGKIRDSNRCTLLALLAGANAEAIDLGLVPDDDDAITAAIRGGVADCDAVITSGGVSVGDFDYVKVVLDRLSEGQMQWMQVAIRPAKPLAFGSIGGTPVFGLPGNPVSSMVSFELFARPALRQMMGHARLDRPTVRAIADDGLPRRPDGKLHLVRVRAQWSPDDARFHARAAGGQGSHQLHAMAEATGLALVPDGDGVATAGEVDVLLLGWPDA